MKTEVFILNFILVCVFSLNTLSAVPNTRRHLLMDYNWKFIQSDVKDAENPDFDDTGWRTLNLPHDWSIEGEFHRAGARRNSID